MNHHITVVIASLGRPASLRAALEQLQAQTRMPDHVIISVETEADVPSHLPDSLNIDVIAGPRGSSQQRNRALDRLDPRCDIVAFFDDDYLPSKYAIAGILRAFDTNLEVSGFCGRLIADGAASEGIPTAEALHLVNTEEERIGDVMQPSIVKGMAGVYGCNMAFRTTDIDQVRFDERVPLYGWLEDTDFAARLPRATLYTDAFYGVHCAVKQGREARGLRYGYSQIMNPFYFWKKGTVSTRHAVSLVVRPLMANFCKIFWPERWVDRTGRLIGNLRALADIARGRVTPEKILTL